MGEYGCTASLTHNKIKTKTDLNIFFKTGNALQSYNLTITSERTGQFFTYEERRMQMDL